jgi:hypothetical protein
MLPSTTSMRQGGGVPTRGWWGRHCKCSCRASDSLTSALSCCPICLSAASTVLRCAIPFFMDRLDEASHRPDKSLNLRFIFCPNSPAGLQRGLAVAASSMAPLVNGPTTHKPTPNNRQYPSFARNCLSGKSPTLGKEHYSGSPHSQGALPGQPQCKAQYFRSRHWANCMMRKQARSPEAQKALEYRILALQEPGGTSLAFA